MTDELGTFTIEAPDGEAPLDPGLLRELRDLLRDDEDLDVGVRLTQRPPEPGEQGAIPVAVEVLALAAPAVGQVARVLREWIVTRRVAVKVTPSGKGRSVEITAGNAKDAERLLAAALGPDRGTGSSGGPRASE